MPPRKERADPGVRWAWFLAALGTVGALAALLADPHPARSAAAQTWTPFVLVSGLLLIGMVAEGDGLFRAAGSQLARSARGGVSVFAGATLLVVVVTATLNLDTSVVFLTPVLIAAARQRGSGERPSPLRVAPPGQCQFAVSPRIQLDQFDRAGASPPFGRGIPGADVAGRRRRVRRHRVLCRGVGPQGPDEADRPGHRGRPPGPRDRAPGGRRRRGARGGAPLARASRADRRRRDDPHPGCAAPS
jgi:CBS domain-containing protein